MGCTHSGLVLDFKVIVKQARKEFQTYKLKIHGWTQSGGVRPFGCCVLIAGYDRDVIIYSKLILLVPIMN